MSEPVVTTNPCPTRRADGSAALKEPVLGVTRYDRFTSVLMTLILVLSVFTLGFGAVWLVNHKIVHPTSSPKVVLVGIPDVGGGDDQFGQLDPEQYGADYGSPDHPTDSTPQEFALESESLQETVKTLLGAVTTAVDMPDLLVEPVITSATRPWGNPRSLNTNGRLGIGKGKFVGVRRQDRWEISFDPGQTEKEYARQLDHFGVELGAIVNGELYLASQLASDKPVVRAVANPNQEKRLYFSWRGGSRRQADVNLLRKAGVPLGDGVVMCFSFTRRKLSNSWPGWNSTRRNRPAVPSKMASSAWNWSAGRSLRS